MRRSVETIRIWLRHPVAQALQVVLLGLVGAWATVYLWSGVSGNLKLATVRAEFEPSLEGGTRVALPPFGVLWARTHQGPLRLDLRVDQIHIEQAIEWLSQGRKPQEAADYLEPHIRRLSKRLVSGTLIAALVGAAIAGMLFRIGWRWRLAAILIGTISVAGPLVFVARDYDTSAFASARYEGELSRAPYVLGALKRGYTNVVENLPTVTRQVVGLYHRLETNGTGPNLNGQSALRVLAISDLHNNPLGLHFALNLARSYRVGLVLVGGDITDLGHPLEGDLLTNWTRFNAPVLFVTGNHDSRAIAEAMSAIPGVRELDQGKVTKSVGLRIAGYGDPAARRSGVGDVNTTPEDLASLTRRIKRDLTRQDPPDIVLVHNFRIAKDIAGLAPVIVTGHSHSASVEDRMGSVVVNSGTTGAKGLRYLTSERDAPQTAAVLHFATGNSTVRLTAVDLIELRQLTGDFVVSRRSIVEPAGPDLQPAGGRPGP